MAITVLIVEDHSLVRSGLAALIESTEGIEVAAVVLDGREAVRLTEELEPDVVLMDVAMPGLNGVEATFRIVQKRPLTKVLALSGHDDLTMVSGMLRAGATGYLLKTCSAEELLQVIRHVSAGDTYLDPEITGAVVADYLKLLEGLNSAPPPMPLDDAEAELLALLTSGKTTEQVAAKLKLSQRSVARQRAALLKKLGLTNAAELTRYALIHGSTLLKN
jgi:DNA-binding NarL/FixJ family response regulator